VRIHIQVATRTKSPLLTAFENVGWAAQGALAAALSQSEPGTSLQLQDLDDGGVNDDLKGATVKTRLLDLEALFKRMPRDPTTEAHLHTTHIAASKMRIAVDAFVTELEALREIVRNVEIEQEVRAAAACMTHTYKCIMQALVSDVYRDMSTQWAPCMGPAGLIKTCMRFHYCVHQRHHGALHCVRFAMPLGHRGVI